MALSVLNLTDEEVRIIQNALYVVVPTGGGSPQFSLYCKIMKLTNVVSDDDLLMDMGRIVVNEAVEAGVVVRVQ